MTAKINEIQFTVNLDTDVLDSFRTIAEHAGIF